MPMRKPGFHKPLASMGPCIQGWQWLVLSIHRLPHHPNLQAEATNYPSKYNNCGDIKEFEIQQTNDHAYLLGIRIWNLFWNVIITLLIHKRKQFFMFTYIHQISFNEKNRNFHKHISKTKGLLPLASYLQDQEYTPCHPNLQAANIKQLKYYQIQNPRNLKRNYSDAHLKLLTFLASGSLIVLGGRRFQSL